MGLSTPIQSCPLHLTLHPPVSPTLTLCRPSPQNQNNLHSQKEPKTSHSPSYQMRKLRPTSNIHDHRYFLGTELAWNWDTAAPLVPESVMVKDLSLAQAKF